MSLISVPENIKNINSGRKEMREFGLTIGAILFYGVVTPIGLLIKLFGKDILDQRISKERPSYWLERSVASK